MRLLFLTPQLPYPPRQGATLRNFHLIRGLASSHTIDLLTFLAPGETLTSDNPLHQLCARVEGLPQPVRTPGRRARETLTSVLPDMARRLDSPHMHAQVKVWLAATHYDVIEFEGIEMAPYLQTSQTALARGDAPTVLVFDNHNCEYLLQKRNALNDLRDPKRLIGGIYSVIQWWKLRRYERWACRAAHVTLAVSAPDAKALRQLAGLGASIHVIENGIDIHPARPSTINPHPSSVKVRLVFTGKMDYRPNIDAVLWFAHQVLPLIAQHYPGACFQIVGMNPHRRILPLDKLPNIEITGAVDDIEPYIQEAAVFVIPLRVGGGTRFKVLEAFAAAKPTVSTSLGVEGIPVKHNEHLLLADTPQSFAQAVLELLDDQTKHGGAQSDRLGKNARQFAAANYAWDTIIPRLEAIYTNVVTPSTDDPNVEVASGA